VNPDQGIFKDQFRSAQSSNSMASVEREPITGIWEPSPQRGSRGQSPRLGSRCEAPPLKLNAFLFLRVHRKLQICPIIDICKSQKITRWMNESLFNDASPTNLRVVTSPISTYSCLWIQSNLTCAPAQFVVFHLLHTDRMQLHLHTVSEKSTPLDFWR